MKDNRVVVDDTLEVEHRPGIFAIGDSAGAKAVDGRYLPMVAPVAMQQARYVAKLIERRMHSLPSTPFVYKDKGSMATIGRHKAVVEVKGLRIGGAIAWYIWLWLHLFYLVGGRNKLGTMAEWSWNYLTFDRGNRHIIDIS
jgi:NADH dehydrogenase